MNEMKCDTFSAIRQRKQLVLTIFKIYIWMDLVCYLYSYWKDGNFVFIWREDSVFLLVFKFFYFKLSYIYSKVYWVSYILGTQLIHFYIYIHVTTRCRLKTNNHPESQKGFSCPSPISVPHFLSEVVTVILIYQLIVTFSETPYKWHQSVCPLVCISSFLLPFW